MWPSVSSSTLSIWNNLLRVSAFAAKLEIRRWKLNKCSFFFFLQVKMHPSWFSLTPRTASSDWTKPRPSATALERFLVVILCHIFPFFKLPVGLSLVPSPVGLQGRKPCRSKLWNIFVFVHFNIEKLPRRSDNVSAQRRPKCFETF